MRDNTGQVFAPASNKDGNAEPPALSQTTQIVPPRATRIGRRPDVWAWGADPGEAAQGGVLEYIGDDPVKNWT